MVDQDASWPYSFLSAPRSGVDGALLEILGSKRFGAHQLFGVIAQPEEPLALFEIQVALGRQQLRDPHLFHDPSRTRREDEQPIGEKYCLLDVVRHEDDGLALL